MFVSPLFICKFMSRQSNLCSAFSSLYISYIIYVPEKHYSICGSTNELCNKFADFFSEKILKIRHQLDALQTDASSNFQHFDNVNMDCELTEFPPTLIEELSGLLKKISTKSCSLDPVPSTLLSYCIDDLLPIIQTVVNSSFESAVVPTSMKKAVAIFTLEETRSGL